MARTFEVAGPMGTTSTDTPTDWRFAVDTTFVLFFLAVDVGRSGVATSFDTVSLVSLGLLLVIPYFFHSEYEKPPFTQWLLGRAVITLFAMGLGTMFGQTVGVVLPEAFKFLPMTLLILSAFASCSLQFYAMIRFRLAR